MGAPTKSSMNVTNKHSKAGWGRKDEGESQAARAGLSSIYSF